MKRFVFPLFILFLLAVLVSCSDVEQNDTLLINGEKAENVYDSGCLPDTMAQTLGDDDLPFEGPGDSGKDECVESVELTWDGERLTVEHFCHLHNCGAMFEVTYEVEEGKLEVNEYNTMDPDMVMFCVCLFDTAGEMELEGGDYQFRLIYYDFENRYTTLDEAISLPAGEERQYSFSP